MRIQLIVFATLGVAACSASPDGQTTTNDDVAAGVITSSENGASGATSDHLQRVSDGGFRHPRRPIWAGSGRAPYPHIPKVTGDGGSGGATTGSGGAPSGTAGA